MSGFQDVVAALLPKESAATIFTLASLATGVPAAIAWWISRRDRLRREELTDEQRRGQELDKRQDSFGQEQARWFGELRTENAALRAELAETRRDRDRGWSLARYWHGAAHDLMRWGRNLRHNYMNMYQWVHSAVRQMRLYVGPDGEPILKMPETIEPVPERPDLPMGLEDPK